MSLAPQSKQSAQGYYRSDSPGWFVGILLWGTVWIHGVLDIWRIGVLLRPTNYARKQIPPRNTEVFVSWQSLEESIALQVVKWPAPHYVPKRRTNLPEYYYKRFWGMKEKHHRYPWLQEGRRTRTNDQTWGIGSTVCKVCCHVTKWVKIPSRHTCYKSCVPFFTRVPLSFASFFPQFSLFLHCTSSSFSFSLSFLPPCM